MQRGAAQSGPTFPTFQISESIMNIYTGSCADWSRTDLSFSHIELTNHNIIKDCSYSLNYLIYLFLYSVSPNTFFFFFSYSFFFTKGNKKNEIGNLSSSKLHTNNFQELHVTTHQISGVAFFFLASPLLSKKRLPIFH